MTPTSQWLTTKFICHLRFMQGGDQLPGFLCPFPSRIQADTAASLRVCCSTSNRMEQMFCWTKPVTWPGPKTGEWKCAHLPQADSDTVNLWQVLLLWLGFSCHRNGDQGLQKLDGLPKTTLLTSGKGQCDPSLFVLYQQEWHFLHLPTHCVFLLLENSFPPNDLLENFCS